MKQLTRNTWSFGCMCVAVSFLTAFPAFGAQENHSSHDPNLGHSVEYALQKITHKAHSLDLNKNGVLDENEKALKRHKLGVLAGYAEDFLDENKDGTVTVEEYIHVQSNMVKRADTNENGWIDPEEEKQQKRDVLKRALSHLSL